MGDEPTHAEHSWGGGLVHYEGGCNDCEARWSARNVIGVAAAHAKRHRHNTWAEMAHAYRFDGQTLPAADGE